MSMTIQRAVLLTALTTSMAVPAAARETNPAKAQRAIDPQADQMLRRMSSYLGGLRSFRVQTEAVDEVVLQSGQKLQQVTASRAAVNRPDHFMSERMGLTPQASLYYDGRTFTMYCPAKRIYSSVPAPPGNDAALDALRGKYGLDAPGADLVYSNAYDVLTDDVTSGQYIGMETINGVTAHHLAFQGTETDWQVWIQDGPQPLPMRYVITSKTMKSQPQFTVQFSRWEPQANVPDAAFEFKPPPGATRVEKFTTECPAATAAPAAMPPARPAPGSHP
jgi:hypothetical protein